MEKEEEGLYLTAGMVSFGIGHIMYFVAVMLYLGAEVNWTVLGISLAIAVVVAVAMVFGGEKLLKLSFGKFKIHSLIYAFMLVFMGALSVALCISMKSTKMLLFAIGMILFFLSDAVLSTMYFGGKPKDKLLIIVNHALYYAAQICIATFMFYLV